MFGIGLAVLFLWKPPSSLAADIKKLWKFVAGKGMFSCSRGVIGFLVWVEQRL